MNILNEGLFRSRQTTRRARAETIRNSIKRPTLTFPSLSVDVTHDTGEKEGNSKAKSHAQKPCHVTTSPSKHPFLQIPPSCPKSKLSDPTWEGCSLRNKNKNNSVSPVPMRTRRVARRANGTYRASCSSRLTTWPSLRTN